VAAGSDNEYGSDQRLPRGRHGLSRAFVVSNQRERIITALAEVCAAKGYGAVTVEDIIGRAGVSRRTFYDLFSDKQDCFLLAYDAVVDRVFRSVDAAYRASELPWPERVAAGLSALLDAFASEPAVARLVMVEVLAAGRRAVERRDEMLRRFEVFFTTGTHALPVSEAERALIARAVVGGISEALYTRIITGETERLPQSAPELLYCALVPYLGHAQAAASSSRLRG
jgi:AcrR family transcriptional regulator